VVLSHEEVSRFFENLPNLKHRALIMTAYATGMRVSEAVSLRCTRGIVFRQVRGDQEPAIRRRFVAGSSGDLRFLGWRAATDPGGLAALG
jgi:integrase